MASIPRPTLEEAARAWLDTKPDADAPRNSQLRAALEHFLAKRFRGAAADVKAVHTLRQSLLDDDRHISSLFPDRAQSWDGSSVGKAAADSAPPEQGRLLFSLVRHLDPRVVLEFGTNIGISAAYIQVGLQHAGQGSLTTMEASGARVELARRNFDALGLGHPNWVEGYFDDMLPGVLERLGEVDMVFVDGNHKRDATVRYFEMLVPKMPSGGLMVLDDIRWSEGMLEAWDEVRSRPEAATTVDLGRTGLVVVA